MTTPDPETPPAPEDPNVPTTPPTWEDNLDNILLSDDTENEKSDKILALMPLALTQMARELRNL